MTGLKNDWLTDGLIDFEYKKYVLLAYLKDVRTYFDAQKLFPYLSDLVFHYQNLQSIKKNKRLLFENFPKVISKADFEKLQLTYKRIIEDDDIMQEIEEILTFSIPKLKDVLDEGKDIFEYIESNLEILPVGVCPLYADEGYMLIDIAKGKELKVYRYRITVFENYEEKYRGIHTEYLESEKKGLGITYESLKLQLIKKYRELPNPATYLVNSKLSLPFRETLLPVAKRLLVRYVNSTGKN